MEAGGGPEHKTLSCVPAWGADRTTANCAVFRPAPRPEHHTSCGVPVGLPSTGTPNSGCFGPATGWNILRCFHHPAMGLSAAPLSRQPKGPQPLATRPRGMVEAVMSVYVCLCFPGQEDQGPNTLEPRINIYIYIHRHIRGQLSRPRDLIVATIKSPGT